MGSRNQKRVFLHTEVDVPLGIDGENVLFRISPDGTIYFVEEKLVKPKYEWEKEFCKKTQKPPYRVRRETLRVVKNPAIQKMVFGKYLNDLEKRANLEEHLTAGKESNAETA